jgi:crossover junction endodeoxyribonuclease RuvC
MSVVIGIDPGLSGAIAWLGPNGGAHVVDMPTIQLSKTGFVKRALDVNGLTILLEGYAAATNPRPTVYMERVNAFPGQGVGSMFSLGMSFWGAAGVIAGIGLALVLVEPKDWKGYFRLNKDKELARGLASRYYPSVDLHRKKDHGRAEALLIARYGQEKV